MPFYAEKTWAATGKEKGTPDNLRNLVAKTGDAPRVNPYSKASKSGDTYAEYEFNDLKDASANGRDLTAGKNAEVKDGALNLAGGESYVESPLNKISAGTRVILPTSSSPSPPARATSSLRRMPRTARSISA